MFVNQFKNLLNMSQSENKKVLGKLVKKDRASQIIKRTIEEKETEFEVDESQIRPSVNKKFYGYSSRRDDMSLALDITTDQGDYIGLQYHLISSFVRFDSSGTISFLADGHQIKIEGRNLRPVYEYLLEHRLIWIAAKISEYEEFPEGETVIDSIIITPVNELS